MGDGQGAGAPFDTALGTKTLMNSVKEKHTLNLIWALPSLYKTWLRRSTDYVGNLIGHEGAGSLLSELKKRAWANDITAGVSSDGYNTNTCTYNFDIEVVLTDTGLASHEQVIDLIFGYIALLRGAGPQEAFYNEEAATRVMEFRHLEQEDSFSYAEQLSQNMLWPGMTPEHVVYPHLWMEFHPEEITRVTSQLVPRGMVVLLSSPR